jgi:glycosyltransferase involved in cell wall biosynthesis
MIGRVAIALPFYSSIKYIHRTMQTLIRQYHDNYKIFAVSDGSKGNLLQIMRWWEGQHPDKVRVLEQENMGPGGALNTAFDAANEEGGFDYGTMVSADNLYKPNFLSTLVKVLEEDDGTVMAYGDFVYIDANDNPGQVVVHRHISKHHLVDGYDCGAAFLFRMSAKNKAGFYWRRICEDYDMAVRIGQFGEFKVVNEVLMGYRVSPKQLTGSSPIEEQRAAEHSRRLARKLFMDEDTRPEDVYPPGVDPYIHRRDEDA